MVAATRTALVRHIFREAGPAEELSAAEVAQRLLRHGHDFGPVTNATAGAKLTTPILNRLAEGNELTVVDPTDEQPRWTLPRPNPGPTTQPAQRRLTARTHATAPPTEPDRPPTQQAATGDVSRTAVTLVALLEALTVILLICAVWPQ